MAETEGITVTLTIRDIDPIIKKPLRQRAVEHGRSMGAEAREILRSVLGVAGPDDNLAERVRARFGPLGGVDLVIPPRNLLPFDTH